MQGCHHYDGEGCIIVVVLTISFETASTKAEGLEGRTPFCIEPGGPPLEVVTNPWSIYAKPLGSGANGAGVAEAGTWAS
jgi:hypothetical protein